MKHRKLTGAAGWVGGNDEWGEGTAEAVFRQGKEHEEFGIDYKEEDRRICTLSLKSEDGIRFRGRYEYLGDGDKFLGDASLRLYKNKEGLLLFGTSKENGNSYTWWFELMPD